MACIVAGVAGAADAATVQFRLRERQGQSSWNPGLPTNSTNDANLWLTLEAHVIGGGPTEGIGNWAANIITSDPDSASTPFFRARITNIDGSYNTTFSTNNVNGEDLGMAKQYNYLQGVNPNFSGLFNQSAGSWTQTPNNDIGLIAGSPSGAGVLKRIDQIGGGPTGDDPDGNPDTYVGPTGPVPNGSTAAVDPLFAHDYLGALGEDGHWVELYRFLYVIPNSVARTLSFTIDGAQAQTFSQFAFGDGIWGPANPANATITTTNYSLSIVPAPGAAALLGLGGLLAGRRRRA